MRRNSGRKTVNVTQTWENVQLRCHTDVDTAISQQVWLHLITKIRFWICKKKETNQSNQFNFKKPLIVWHLILNKYFEQERVQKKLTQLDNTRCESKYLVMSNEQLSCKQKGLCNFYARAMLFPESCNITLMWFLGCVTPCSFRAVLSNCVSPHVWA